VLAAIRTMMRQSPKTAARTQEFMPNGKHVRLGLNSTGKSPCLGRALEIWGAKGVAKAGGRAHLANAELHRALFAHDRPWSETENI
jgi:hypothetical protein